MRSSGVIKLTRLFVFYYDFKSSTKVQIMENYLATCLSTHPEFLKTHGFTGSFKDFIPNLETWLIDEQIPKDSFGVRQLWEETFPDDCTQPSSFGECVAELILQDRELEIFEFLFKVDAPTLDYIFESFDLKLIIASYINKWYFIPVKRAT